MLFEIQDNWRRTHPGACAGVILLQVPGNPTGADGLAPLEEARLALEANLREQFGGLTRADLASLPVIQAYNQYYRRFDKSYVVQLQLESVIFKGKSIPSISGLVEAMFMAEVKNQMLTAGHDADTLSLPVTLDSSAGGEEYNLLRGSPQVLKAGDMIMRDGGGIISSVIYGPDQRTQITPATRRALYAVYAPPGVGEGAVRAHIGDIESYVRLFSPAVEVEFSSIVRAEE
jgi:DNA/RNA-binding domain of Phe-tRNA-synthetase-like protein